MDLLKPATREPAAAEGASADEAEDDREGEKQPEVRTGEAQQHKGERSDEEYGCKDGTARGYVAECSGHDYPYSVCEHQDAETPGSSARFNAAPHHHGE